MFDHLISKPYTVNDLFMGSSHTLNGVDDEVIEQALGSGASYNAAIPTSGRDFQYVVLKDVLKRGQVQRLFLEVRETEERTSHFGFPIVAQMSDVFTAPPNPWWIKNVTLAIRYRFERLVQLAFPEEKNNLVGVRYSRFGYVPNHVQMAREELVKQADTTFRTKRWRLLPNMFGDLEFAANERYVHHIAELCREKKIELHFLYLPFLRGPQEPAQAHFYRSLGTLHLLPDYIRTNPQYFADPTHLNPLGAAIYTKWVIEHILRPKPRALR